MPTIKEVAKAYMTLRSKREELDRQYKQDLEAIVSNMDKMEAFFLAKMHEEGVTTYKTEFGTVFKTTTDFFRVADWDAVLAFVKENDAYGLLERRVNKQAAKSYVDEGLPIPPGVDYMQRVNINVRKPNKE
jgi:hypothetical protein